ncbi:MAG: hypothetical protein HC850_15610 [Rhodomicrobium sp.]|nr:hypothetical protein [Rhodomicrobium sp.]
MNTDEMADPAILLQVWLSPSFPTGAFAYSQGLEAAAAQGLVASAAGLSDWLSAMLAHGAVWNDLILIAAAMRTATRPRQPRRQRPSSSTPMVNTTIEMPSSLSGTFAPASSVAVGRKSQKAHGSSPTRPAGTVPGHRASAAYTAAKMLWLKRHQPEIYAATHKFLFAKDYCVLKLTGEAVTDYSDASGSTLFDLASRCWRTDFLDALELDADKLPDVVSSQSVVGGVTQSAAAQTGLRAGTPVVIGGGDGACATIGAGASNRARRIAC